MASVTKNNSFKWSATTSILALIAYLITWRFYAMWWFLIFFADLFIFLLFFTVTLRSVVFWITKTKEFRFAFLPFFINILIMAVITIAPSIYLNKSYFKGGYELHYSQCNNCSRHLYVETYCVFKNGFLSTDVNSVYLTDSLNFRKYLGTYDEGDAGITTTCTDDSVFVEKGYPFYKTDQISYSLKSLIKSHLFE